MTLVLPFQAQIIGANLTLKYFSSYSDIPYVTYDVLDNSILNIVSTHFLLIKTSTFIQQPKTL